MKFTTTTSAFSEFLKEATSNSRKRTRLEELFYLGGEIALMGEKLQVEGGRELFSFMLMTMQFRHIARYLDTLPHQIVSVIVEDGTMRMEMSDPSPSYPVAD